MEILTGIKAHTIRIWEKRYGLLNPARISGNVRVYSILDLQKILNVSLLVHHKYKISSLAQLTDGELENEARLISIEDLTNDYHLNSLILCMFSFNEEMFEEIYRKQIESLSFEEIFVNSYAPLLDHIGVLWQTKGIYPAHEHFISNLIKQKIALNIAQIPIDASSPKRVNVLFLPEGEVHDLGLHFLYYRLKSIGEKTVFLGKDIPFDNLLDINSQFQEINWVCSFMIDKTAEDKELFLTNVSALINSNKNTCWIIGKIWSNYDASNTDDRITFFHGFEKV